MASSFPDLYQSEGFYYSRNHLIDSGCIENYNDENVFAYHAQDDWQTVVSHLRSVWGYDMFWFGPALMKSSAMRNGQTNYVFRITRQNKEDN